MEFSLVHTYLLDSRVFANDANELGINRDGGLLDYCFLNDITVQAWSPMLASWTGGTFIDNPAYPKLNAMLQDKADAYGVTKNTIAIAWILRHPYGIQPIVGTVDPEHLRQVAAACEVKLTRQDWYDLYLAEGKPMP